MSETICIRCGKTRIFARRWQEKVDGKGSVITHEESVCPDPECQKIVDQQFAEARNRRITFADKRNIKLQGAAKT